MIQGRILIKEIRYFRQNSFEKQICQPLSKFSNIIKGTLMCLIMDVILWRAGLAKINSGVPGYVLQTNIHTEIGTGTRTEA